MTRDRPFLAFRFILAMILVAAVGAAACGSDPAPPASASSPGGAAGSDPGSSSAGTQQGSGGSFGSSGSSGSGGSSGSSGTSGSGGSPFSGSGGSAGGGGDSFGGGDDGGTIEAGVLDAGNSPGQCTWRQTAPVTVATPFAAPDNSLTFTPPAIPCAIFSITSYGAKSDGTTLNTVAFSQAVAAAKAVGGGVVDVPAGTFLTGAIHLDSNIELHLETGAVVKFSTSTADYQPLVLTRWEGLDVMNWSPMIYALGATNVAITGAGTLQGPGESWGGGVATWKSGAAAEDQRIYDAWTSRLANLSGPPTAAQVPVSGVIKGLRPTFVECNGCTNFMVDGPTLTGSVYWTIHPLYSKNVIIRNAKIDTTSTGSNGDGTDPDSCENTLIDRVTYATSDDIIAVKSGLNEVGIAVNRPNHNLVVRNVTGTAGHGFSIGSEMSGGVNNVYVTADMPLTWSNQQYLLRIKTLAGRGGVVQGIFFENVEGTAISNALLLTTAYGSSTIAPHSRSALPVIKDITVKNVNAAGGISLLGISAASPLQNITFDHVTVTGPWSCRYATGLSLVSSSIGFTGNGC